MENVSLFVVFLFLNGVFGDTVSESVSVMEGDSVTLHTSLTEVEKGHVIDWRFGPNSILIARVNSVANTANVYTDVIGESFRGRLHINQQIGDLNITNIRTEHSGLYKLSIHGKNIDMLYNVSVVSDKRDGLEIVPVMKGDYVILHTDAAEIQKYHLIQWMFGNTVICTFNKTYQVPPILNKLEVDRDTGSLKIRSIRTEQCGTYNLQMISSTHTIQKRFNITIFDAVKSVSVMEGDSVTLESDITKIYDEIQFEYDDSIIAKISRAAQNFSTFDGPDGRFRHRLKLDNQTGSLTITNITNQHTGFYHLHIFNSRHTVHKSFVVNVCNVVKYITVKVGESFTLDTGVTDIQKYGQLLWKFGGNDTLVSKINGTHPVFSTHERFKDRILYHENGSLTIEDTRFEHAGSYRIEMSSSRNTLLKRFSVLVTGKIQKSHDLRGSQQDHFAAIIT
uniref:Immunoglobulin domain-containing protein n=1 Tax=Cyprinus carpio TaxID=7962 RepID=A0A8C1TFG0_CYPCA